MNELVPLASPVIDSDTLPALIERACILLDALRNFDDLNEGHNLSALALEYCKRNKAGQRTYRRLPRLDHQV
jgi:hypothetical protein